MLAYPKLPISVTLRWVPGSMHLVRFLAWGRTFVVALADVVFISPLVQSPLYLKGSVQVRMSDVTLSGSEQAVFDDLQRASERDNVLQQDAPDDFRPFQA
ncbi:hypothetical protein D3875_00330 [Deinococcus cavernae]|uniref:Uncharacterized protein n=1 Tax=Deinococcus cavernae TaxID=2320857 RepID=A0A418VIG2_9DEIO|nr:hypothetical protein [Deinococcus cavernae]RJF75939.1 hypothetical protein D3875_00330 [Deinococcus cavernae]